MCGIEFEKTVRAHFPKGLQQPAGSYRFAVDSLLLACFIRPEKGGLLLDIGTGCGVVALGALCLQPDLQVYGLEREPELAAAARTNGEALGFGDRLRIIESDAGRDGIFIREPDRKEEAGLPPTAFDVVLANPPFRRPDRGRLPPNPVRLRALFEEENTLDHFCLCAAKALKPQGRFGILYDAARRDYLLAALERAGMVPVRLLPVRTHPDKAPLRILAEAVPRRQGRSPLLLQEQPLTLHPRSEGIGKYSEEAAAFCPFL